MDLRCPDVFAHRAGRVLSPDDFRLGRRQAIEVASAADLDTVVFRDRRGEVVLSVRMEEYVRIGALSQQRILERYGSGGRRDGRQQDEQRQGSRQDSWHRPSRFRSPCWRSRSTTRAACERCTFA
jgi:hypothetical protein